MYAGGTTTQHCFYWKTFGAPQTWTIAACDRYCEHWFEWDGDLTSFLAAVATRRVPDWIVAGPTRFPLLFRDIATLARPAGSLPRPPRTRRHRQHLEPQPFAIGDEHAVGHDEVVLDASG